MLNIALEKINSLSESTKITELPKVSENKTMPIKELVVDDEDEDVEDDDFDDIDDEPIKAGKRI
jgi:hypothetical protein